MLYLYHRNAVYVQHLRRYCNGRDFLRGHQSVHRKGEREEDQYAYVYSGDSVCAEVYYAVGRRPG